MKNLFNMDSPVMTFLTKVFDLVWLNLLTVVFSIPIVTIGAAITAMDTVELKLIIRDRGSSVTKEFLKAFRENLKQATAMWLIYLVILCVLVGDLFLIRTNMVQLPPWLSLVLVVIGVFVLTGAAYTFAMQSHYENTIGNTIKNAWILMIANLPWTVLMVLGVGLWCLVLSMFFYRILPLILVLGISVPGWFVMLLMQQIFRKLDPPEEEQ